MLKTLYNIFYSIRPSASLGAALLASAAAYEARHPKTAIISFLAIFSEFAACFLINDLADKEKDKKNNKTRPIATGELSDTATKISISTFLMIYILGSIWLGSIAIVICLISLIIIFSYSWLNNRFGFFANFLVATCTVLVLAFGSSSISAYLGMLGASLFFLLLAREIMLDGLDVKGDLAIGKPSIPIRYGSVGTKRFVLVFYLFSTIPLILLILAKSSLSLFPLMAILTLWVPLVFSFAKRMDHWMLFNIRWTHAYFLLTIILLVLK